MKIPYIVGNVVRFTEDVSLINKHNVDQEKPTDEERKEGAQSYPEFLAGTEVIITCVIDEGSDSDRGVFMIEGIVHGDLSHNIGCFWITEDMAPVVGHVIVRNLPEFVTEQFNERFYA